MYSADKGGDNYEKKEFRSSPEIVYTDTCFNASASPVYGRGIRIIYKADHDEGKRIPHEVLRRYEGCVLRGSEVHPVQGDRLFRKLAEISRRIPILLY